MSKRNIFAEARRSGKAMTDCRNVLPRLARAAAVAAHQGHITTDDAADLYAAYFEATGEAHEPTSGSARANISKLRKVIEAGSTCGELPQVFDRLELLHKKVVQRTHAPSLYSAMIETCRVYCNNGRIPSDRVLMRVLTRK